MREDQKEYFQKLAAEGEYLRVLIRDYQKRETASARNLVLRHLENTMLFVPGQLDPAAQKELEAEREPGDRFTAVDASDVDFTPEVLDGEDAFYIPAFTQVEPMRELYGPGAFLMMNAPALMELVKKQDGYGGFCIDPSSEMFQVDREEFPEVLRQMEDAKKAQHSGVQREGASRTAESAPAGSADGELQTADPDQVDWDDFPDAPGGSEGMLS